MNGMDDFLIPFDLSQLPKIDKEKRKDEIIEAKKSINKILKDSRTQSKTSQCYYCGNECNSFCNSHTVPAFCLRNIAYKGQVFYSNTILDLPILKDAKGVNEAGTFHLICRDCDSKIFQNYENPDNYEKTPSISMLAQIDMKNNLKNISKRLMELEMYDLMQERVGIDSELVQTKNMINDLDLKEFEASYNYAKKHSLKPSRDDYYIGFYTKLPYVVPVAFQGTIALITDLEGSIINYVYNHNPKYRIRNMSLCIFPLKSTSIIMIFVEKGNKRYSKFFRQLKKLGDLEAQLNVINYILFSYSEDFFLSANISKDILDELIVLFRKTPTMIASSPTMKKNSIEEAKKIYDYSERIDIPNLLSNKFALTIEDN